MRFSSVLITYFIISAVMWGGGVISWQESGVGGAFIEDPTADSQAGAVDQNTTTLLNRLGGPITQVAGQTSGGGLIATWQVLVSLIGFVFWPTALMISVNAPPSAVVLATALPVAFVTSVLRMVRGSA